ncbi:MAG: hypothetical protein AAGI91_07540 [Bacteroidota bacterium]
MTTTETQFVTDDAGQRIAVLIGLDRYQQLLDAVEEIDSIRAYDEAKASGDEAIPFDEATREIEQNRGAG